MSDISSRPLRVFLCHASQDKPIVRELYRRLDAEGWINVWLDEQELLPGMDWNLEIEKAVEAADVIIVCFSSNSVTKEGYVQRELRYALEIALEKPDETIFIVPLRLDDCPAPRRLRGWQYADYFPEEDRDRAYGRLLASLRKRASDLGIPAKQKADLESRDLENEIDLREKVRRQIEDPAPQRIPRKLTLDKSSLAMTKIMVAGLIVLLLIAGGIIAYRNIFAQPPSTSTPPIGVATSPSPSTSVTVETPTLTSVETPVRVESTLISPEDGMPVVYVPAGEFMMGSNDGTPEERPAHTVRLDGFWIDKTEVTVEMYSRCVSAGVCEDKSLYTQTDYLTNPDFHNYPMILVSWEDATTYCGWVERRLPTEAEWEKAARGENGLVYPWGNEFDGSRVNFCDTNCSGETPNPSFIDTAPVGSYLDGASPYGALDMAGNVWELVSDWYDAEYYAGSPDVNPTGPESGEYRVMRGGSWVTQLEFGLRTSYRSYVLPNIGNTDIGFRCADSP